MYSRCKLLIWLLVGNSWVELPGFSSSLGIPDVFRFNRGNELIAIPLNDHLLPTWTYSGGSWVDINPKFSFGENSGSLPQFLVAYTGSKCNEVMLLNDITLNHRKTLSFRIFVWKNNLWKSFVISDQSNSDVGFMIENGSTIAELPGKDGVVVIGPSSNSPSHIGMAVYKC